MRELLQRFTLLLAAILATLGGAVVGELVSVRIPDGAHPGQTVRFRTADGSGPFSIVVPWYILGSHHL